MRTTMNSLAIQEAVYNWACNANFTAPYGVLVGGPHKSKTGRKYLSVTFGYARTLDATVEIYNHGFMIYRSSRGDSVVFKSYEDLHDFLQTI